MSLNKIDIYPEELVKAVVARFKKAGEQLLLFSGITGEGLDKVRKAVFEKKP